MDNDTTFKRVFSYQIMVRELLDWFVGRHRGGRQLVDSLDLSKLRRAHEQTVAGTRGDLHRFAGDVVWEVPFGQSPDPDPKAWLELVLLGEFQRTPDHLMPLRVRNYVDCHHMDALRAGERRFGASDRLPPVLPIVIYTGRQKWTAARRVVDLVSPVAGRSPEAVDLSARQSGLFAGDGYLLLDIHRLGPDDFQGDNAASLLMELTSPPQETRTTVKLAGRLLDLFAEEDLDLLEVLFAWVRQESGLDLGVNQMAEVARLDGSTREDFLEERVVTWYDRLQAESAAAARAEGLETGRAEGLETGRAEVLADERALLVRQAGLKFDAGTGRRLAGLLAQTNDPSRFAEVGGWIITCGTGAELIARVAGGGNGAEGNL